MILLGKTNMKRSRFSAKTTATNNNFPGTNQVSAFLLLCFSFLCAIGNAADVDHGSTSSTVSAGADRRHHQQQPTQRDLQISRIGRPTTLVETFSCIPAAEIQAIHQDRDDDRLPWSAGNEIDTACYSQQNSCGSNDGTAPSACCRVSYDAGWLVCDTYNAFDHMPCVCNDNTFGSPTPQPTTQAPTTLEPTNEPTKYPTMRPTKYPTMKPTDQPTRGPTDQPTDKPTYRPTYKPTNKPTNKPTVSTKPPTTIKPTEEPTSAPIVTPFPTFVRMEFPTTQPTLEPTAAPTTRSPTAKPTIPPYYTTEDKYDDDLDATIRQSQCTEDPPVIEFVQASTFVYRYELTLSTKDAAAATSVNMDDLYDEKTQEVSELGTRELHDELAREFMVCGSGADAYQYDTVWILQSKTHEVDNGAECSTSSSLVSQDGISVERAKDDTAETDEDSNDAPNDDNNKCVVMKAEARIIAYQSPYGRKTNKQLWSDSNAYENGPVAESFAADAIAFLGSILNEGELENFSSATDSRLANINVSFKGGEIVADGAANANAGESEEEVIVEVGKEYKGDTESNGDSNADQETSNDGSSSVSIEGEGDEVDNNGSNVGGGNTAAGVAGSINSNTNNKKGLTPVVIATIAVVVGVLVLLILMGVSSRRKRKMQREEGEQYLQNAEIGRNDSFQYAMGGLHHLDLSEDSDGDEPGPIVRSELDLEENYSSNLSPTGVEQQQQFFNISGVVRSPSSRQRSQMGPLGKSDEFLDSQSISTAHTDGRKGNHRGDLALTLSLPSSLSPPDIAPPIQNTSPRTYQLRDTVKL